MTSLPIFNHRLVGVRSNPDLVEVAHHFFMIILDRHKPDQATLLLLEGFPANFPRSLRRKRGE
jgi:hypothetical protein